MTVEFHNGSYIRVIPASDNARGYRMHLLIADENINDDVLRRLKEYERDFSPLSQ